MQASLTHRITITSAAMSTLHSNEDLKNQEGTNPNYQGSGGAISRFVTPGGHPMDNSQPAFPVFHRKFANPAPLGLMG